MADKRRRNTKSDSQPQPNDDPATKRTVPKARRPLLLVPPPTLRQTGFGVSRPLPRPISPDNPERSGFRGWPGGSQPSPPPLGDAYCNGPFCFSMPGVPGAIWPNSPFGGAYPNGPFGGAYASGPFGGAYPNGPFGGAYCNGPFCFSMAGFPGAPWPNGPFGGAWSNGPFGNVWPNGPSGDPKCNCSGAGAHDDSDKPLPVGLGWHAEMPDVRDLQLGCDDHLNRLRSMFDRAPQEQQDKYRPAHLLDDVDPPPFYDVRTGLLPDFDTPAKRAALPQPTRKVARWSVEDQQTLNSCTSHAVIGLVEYLIRWQLNQAVDLSRLFLYAATRRLLGWTGDPGAYIRSTMKALVVFGAPPEDFWPYDLAHFNADPDAFLFSYAASFKALTYLRLDSNQMSAGSKAANLPGGTPSRDTLRLLTQSLADGYPVAFGFPVYSCIRDNRPKIPVPTIDDRLIGGHAVLAVGYDQTKFGGRGGIRFRNSWGDAWGTRGYGWLPYSYVTDGLACDFWTIFNQSWIDGTRFQ